MSKAFTKEDDDAPAAPAHRRGIPVPVPNFVTARGLAAARAELDELGRTGGDPDRIRELVDHLATAQVADVPDPAVAGLGAAVTVEDGAGRRTTYIIVGAIESDPKQHLIGWQSPLATALWGARAGDTVELPRGDEVEIVAIAYDP
jgi:transcription elongation GreA/GreB family factor